MFVNTHRTLHVKTVDVVQGRRYYAVVIKHDTVEEEMFNNYSSTHTFEEEIATCYDKVAVDLLVRGASSLGWGVYDVDRELWLCGTMDQLAPKWEA